MPTEELFGAYHFLLEIQGVINDNKIIVGGFKSVTGMDSETEIVEFKQGNDMVVRKKPGRTTYANIVLERGYTATDDLWQWRKNIEDGKIVELEEKDIEHLVQRHVSGSISSVRGHRR